MKTRLLISLAITLLFFSLGCEEQNEIIYEPDARLIWTGTIDEGGCGFYIQIDSTLYKPENEHILPPEYRLPDTLNVSVQFIDLLYEMEYSCGDPLSEQKTKAVKLTALDLNQELPDQIPLN